MRWDDLFDDLEGQLELDREALARHQSSDEERQRQAGLTLHDRLRNLTRRALQRAGAILPAADIASPINVTLTTGLQLNLVPLRHGRDWCAVDITEPGSLAGQALLPISAISSLVLTTDQRRLSLGESPFPPEEPNGIANRIGLGFVLRDLSRRRATVEISTKGDVYRGTLDRVSADHVEIAEHLSCEPRRNENVRGVRLVAMTRIVLVRVL